MNNIIESEKANT